MEKRLIEVVDSTILSTLDECPRKCQVQFQMGWRPKGGKKALDFGRIYHDAVHVYYKMGKDLLAALAVLEAIPNVETDEEDKDIRTRSKAEELVTARDRLFRNEDWEWIGGEQQFVIDIPGVPMRYAGFIDAFGKEITGNGQYVIQEEKTSKSPWYFCANPNAQVTGYIYAARTLFNQDIRRAHITMAGIYKSSIGGKVPAKRKADPPHEAINREIIDVNPWDLDEWVLDLGQKVEELVTYQKQDYWPKRTRACGAYGGCPYKPICLAPPRVREFFLESQFDQEFWSPLDERR